MPHPDGSGLRSSRLPEMETDNKFQFSILQFFLPRIFVITLVIPRKPCWSLPEKEQLSPRIDRGTNYFRDSKVCVVALSKITAPVVTSIPRKSFGRWELTLERAIISYFVRGIVNDGRAEFCENSR